MTTPEEHKIPNLHETRKELTQQRLAARNPSNVHPIKRAPAKKAPAKKVAAKKVAKAPAKKAAAKAPAAKKSTRKAPERPALTLKWTADGPADRKGRKPQTGSYGNRKYVITGSEAVWNLDLKVDGKSLQKWEKISYSAAYRIALDHLNDRETGNLPPIRDQEHPWYAKSSYTAKPGMKLYEAKAESGQISVQSFAEVMTHAVSLAKPKDPISEIARNGRIHSFHRSLEAAQRSAAKLNKEPDRAVVVPAQPYRGQGEDE